MPRFAQRERAALPAAVAEGAAQEARQEEGDDEHIGGG